MFAFQSRRSFFGSPVSVYIDTLERRSFLVILVCSSSFCNANTTNLHKTKMMLPTGLCIYSLS